MSMVDSRKLIAWISGAGKAPVELLFLAQRGEETDARCLGTWEPPHDAARVVAEALDIAQSDCNALRSRCNYAIKVSGEKAGKSDVFRRFALAPALEGDIAATGTEPPTAHGVLSQIMRHQEALARVGTGHQIDVGEAWRGLFSQVQVIVGALADEARSLRQQRREDEERYYQSRQSDQQFQLEMLKIGSAAQRSEKLLETVVAPLMPHLLRQALGAPSVPAPAPAGGPAPPPAATGPAEAPAPPPAVTAPASESAGPLRDFVLLCVTEGVDPEDLAGAVAEKVPEARRDEARGLLLGAVKTALVT